MGLQPPKSRKVVICGINLPPNAKFWGSAEKVEHRCTTTNLPACNGTIIVLKVTLIYSVSVITNFIIPKRDKQAKNITLFRLSRRATHNPHHTWHGDRGGPYHFCILLIFFDPISQPHQSCLDSPPHPLLNPSLSSSPSSITPSLFHSRLKTYLFNKSFPP